MGLKHKKILIGITGSVACYKTIELVKMLKNQGVFLKVVLTPQAEKFLTPLIFEAIIGEENVYINSKEKALEHIRLAKWAELILVAPCTAQTIASIHAGFAAHLLLEIILATLNPVVLIPAMNPNMWLNPITQRNIQELKKHYSIWGPETGQVICGDTGIGKMLDLTAIMHSIVYFFSAKPLENKKVLITAGPTIEPLDAVRYLSNYSSGKMGYFLAQVAYYLGAKVTLVTGPTALKPVFGICTINVKTADEMFESVIGHSKDQDIFIAAAAVADMKIKSINSQKTKKEAMLQTPLEFVYNKDILKEVASLKSKPFCVGFAAETSHLESYAKEKLISKGADMIIANEVGVNKGFMMDENETLILTRKQIEKTPVMKKSKLAYVLWQKIIEEFISYK